MTNSVPAKKTRERTHKDGQLLPLSNVGINETRVQVKFTLEFDRGNLSVPATMGKAQSIADTIVNAPLPNGMDMKVNGWDILEPVKVGGASAIASQRDAALEENKALREQLAKQGEQIEKLTATIEKLLAKVA